MGALGYGTGTLTVTPKNEDGDGPDMKADLSLMMVAAGTRGELVSPGADGGPGLALESDAMFVRTESDASSGAGGNLAAAKADVSRLRLALVDGSWGIALAGGAALTPVPGTRPAPGRRGRRDRLRGGLSPTSATRPGFQLISSDFDRRASCKGLV